MKSSTPKTANQRTRNRNRTTFVRSFDGNDYKRAYTCIPSVCVLLKRTEISGESKSEHDRTDDSHMSCAVYNHFLPLSVISHFDATFENTHYRTKLIHTKCAFPSNMTNFRMFWFSNLKQTTKRERANKSIYIHTILCRST